jgi:hypothetical protein
VVGAVEGASVLGAAVEGADDGAAVDGANVGGTVGASVGAAVEGAVVATVQAVSQSSPWYPALQTHVSPLHCPFPLQTTDCLFAGEARFGPEMSVEQLADGDEGAFAESQTGSKDDLLRYHAYVEQYCTM